MFNRTNINTGKAFRSSPGRSLSARELVSDQSICRCKFLSKVPAAIFSMVLLLMFYHGFSNPWNETFVSNEFETGTEIKSSIGVSPFNHDVISNRSPEFNLELVYENEVEDETCTSKKNKRFSRSEIVPYYSISGKFELFQTILQPDYILTEVFRKISKNVLLSVFRI